MGHRVPQKVRMQLDAGDGAIFGAQRTHATIRQCASLTDKHVRGLHRGPGVEIYLERPTSRKRQRHRPLLVALGEPKNHAAAALAHEEIAKLKLSEVADTTAG